MGLEHTGDKPIPISQPTGLRSWFSVYLDNWDQFTVGPESMYHLVKDKPSPEQIAIRAACVRMRVRRSEKEDLGRHDSCPYPRC